jgi:alkylhydroperoxidase family enzyme
MAALKELPVDKWDADSRAYVEGGEEIAPMEARARSMLAHAPNMVAANGGFMEAAMNGRKISRRLLELVRLRIAFHNQCQTCMTFRFQSAFNDGFTEDMVCSLEKPHEDPNLSEADKAALEYADLFATNHFAITDAHYTKLAKYFSEQEIVELGLFSAYFLGYGRFLRTINVVEELDSKEQNNTRIGPWQVGKTVVIDDTDPRRM